MSFDYFLNPLEHLEDHLIIGEQILDIPKIQFVLQLKFLKLNDLLQANFFFFFWNFKEKVKKKKIDN